MHIYPGRRRSPPDTAPSGHIGHVRLFDPPALCQSPDRGIVWGGEVGVTAEEGGIRHRTATILRRETGVKFLGAFIFRVHAQQGFKLPFSFGVAPEGSQTTGQRIAKRFVI